MLNTVLSFYDIFTLSLSLSPSFFNVVSISRLLDSRKLVHCFPWDGDVTLIILVTFFPILLYLLGMKGPDIEDTGEPRVHKVKEILCFVLCPFANLLCGLLRSMNRNLTVSMQERQHQAVITLIQNKCFPNLWKLDYIGLICPCTTFSGLNSNVAETRCAQFCSFWLQLRPSWAGDRGRAVGHCELLTATC